MAKKSKTQRAKASAARAARKEQRAALEAEAKKAEPAAAAETEAPKRKLFAKADKGDGSASDGKQSMSQGKSAEKKAAKKPAKKSRLSFLKDVRLEMKRVTWPTKQDVLRWSVVVVAALLFFGVYVAVLDNVVITPLLVAISGLGA